MGENGKKLLAIPFEQQKVEVVVNDDGKPFVAMKTICENIGLDWSSQLKAVKRDTILNESINALSIDSNGGRQEMICIPLELLNGWLFGIDGTRIKPELREKLITYKKQCYSTLHNYFFKGYSLNLDILEYDIEAQRELAKKIRRIRHEEKSMYASVRDVFKISGVNYEEKDNKGLGSFFAMVQDKFHYAITQKVAAKIILERADASKDNMGLTYTKGEKPIKSDTLIAKNYLTEDELQGLENICEQFLLFIESKAFRNQKMTLEEMATKLNMLLIANDYPVLYEYDSYQRGAANAHAEKEYQKYKRRIEPNTFRKSIASVFVRRKNTTD